MTILWREMTEAEQRRAKALLVLVSDSLREEAYRVGKSIDVMMCDPYYESVVKSVTVDVVARTLMTSTDQEPIRNTAQTLTQTSTCGRPAAVSATQSAAETALYLHAWKISRRWILQSPSRYMCEEK